MRIEKDLHSQHQPSLLPFLQVCANAAESIIIIMHFLGNATITAR